VTGGVAVQTPELYIGDSQICTDTVRNQGTLGGNICQRPRCWYFRGEFNCLRKGGDQCFAIDGENQYHCLFGAEECCIVHPSNAAPALVALDATARVVGPGGGRRDIKVEDFFVLPSQDITRETVLQDNELVTEILLPPPGRGLISSFRKVRSRGAWDFALASVALQVRFQRERVADARVVLGGAAPIPWRSRPVERVIQDTGLDDGVVAKAAAEVIAGAEPLEKNEYKLELFKGLVQEQLLQIRSGG